MTDAPEPMTFDPKEARALVAQIDRSLQKQVGASVVTIHIDDLSSLTGHLTAALDEIEQLRSALDLIATHRAKCHDHDDDMGHQRRDFDAEDVKLMEFAARTALKG